ncbi:MAG TPA: phage tail tube protein [Kaistiaceae bacterium]|nr:phage tail tube protein [Kaistiaceae bacterium]
MTECCHGGVIELEANGIRLSVTGDFTYEPFNFETSAESNHDGTVSGIKKPKPYRASFSFRAPCDVDWVAALKGCRINVTATEVDVGKQHFWTNALVVGTVSVNASTGEVSGMSIETSQYRSVGL